MKKIISFILIISLAFSSSGAIAFGNSISDTDYIYYGKDESFEFYNGTYYYLTTGNEINISMSSVGESRVDVYIYNKKSDSMLLYSQDNLKIADIQTYRNLANYVKSAKTSNSNFSVVPNTWSAKTDSSSTNLPSFANSSNAWSFASQKIRQLGGTSYTSKWLDSETKNGLHATLYEAKTMNAQTPFSFFQLAGLTMAAIRGITSFATYVIRNLILTEIRNGIEYALTGQVIYKFDGKIYYERYVKIGQVSPYRSYRTLNYSLNVGSKTTSASGVHSVYTGATTGSDYFNNDELFRKAFLYY